MMISDYTSINLIKERLLRIPVFNVTWNPEEIVEWATEALQKIGVKEQNIQMVETIKVTDGRCRLPKHLQTIDMVVDNATGQTMDEVYGGEEVGLFLFKRNNDVLIFEEDQGDIILHYTAFPFDDEDQPLIPNHQYYLSAIEAYIRFMLGTKGYYQGKILINELMRLEQDWNFRILSTKGEMKMPNNMKRFTTIHKRNFLA